MSGIVEATLHLLAGSRSLLGPSGGALLSPTAVVLLAGNLYGGQPSREGGQPRTVETGANDANILNNILGGELGAIAAYQLGADSGLLQKPVLDLAIKFQSQHKEHADFLARTVKTLGGTPAEPKKAADYNFPTETLKTQADVLQFAAGLEKGAAIAYLDVIPVLDDRDLVRTIASILGDETMHWAILRQALGQDPVPAAFIVA